MPGALTVPTAISAPATTPSVRSRRDHADSTPTPAIFDGLTGLRARVGRLAEALAAFYERSEIWWRAYEREPELISAWNGGVDQYYADIDRLMRAALDELSADERSVAVVASVIGPPTFFALKARGLSTDDAVRLCVELALPWLELRRELLARGPEAREAGNTCAQPSDVTRPDVPRTRPPFRDPSARSRHAARPSRHLNAARWPRSSAPRQPTLAIPTGSRH
jgi:hypothetical protein